MSQVFRKFIDCAACGCMAVRKSQSKSKVSAYSVKKCNRFAAKHHFGLARVGSHTGGSGLLPANVKLDAEQQQASLGEGRSE